MSKLSQYATIKHGYAFKGQYFRDEEKDYILLTPGNFHIDQRLYFGKNTKFYDGPIPKDYVLKNGDLLVVMTDLTKEMVILGNAVILNSSKQVLHNQRIGKVELLNNDIDLIYLCFLLNSNFVRNPVKATATGTTVRHTSPKKILNVKVSLPPLSEQTKIASFLTAIEEKITQLTQKYDLLNQYKKGVMQQIFSQKLRFKDDDGREFPEWEVKKLSDINLYISDGNYGEQYPNSEQLKQFGVPFIRANNISGLRLTWDDMKYIDHSLHKVLTSGHLETDDILVTTRGDIGMVGYVNREFHGANINAQICLLRVINKSKLNTRYLLQLLSSAYCQKQFKELQTGSALKQLPKKNLMQIEILSSLISEQTKIANFLTAIDDKITHIQTQLDTVKLYKKGLLQQLFV